MTTVGTRLSRFLYETERHYPAATGELSDLLSQLAFAGKRISRILSSAGLTEVLGASGGVNIQGEKQQKLDALANEVFLEAFAYGQLVPTIVTEEMDLPAHLPENVESGKYIVFLDPLDGSSNLDVNGVVGSIFSVRKLFGRGEVTSEAELMTRISREQVVAGYFLYGPSAVLVYTEGRTVHGFTLDPGVGEFLLSHPEIRIPDHGPYYGANEGGIRDWEEGPRRFVEEWAREKDEASGRPYSTRYSGALVADFHRIVLKGGIYLYPATAKSPQGKIRLMYEAAPLALVAEAAGGAASDGRRRILDIAPTSNHQRTPIYLGSRDDVARVDAFVRESNTLEEKTASPAASAPKNEEKAPKMIKTPSGLQYEDTVVGTGASPKPGQKCVMHYTGWLWENEAKGKKFDSSVDRGQPFEFQIGVGMVIKGWDEGVMTMKVGGKRTLLIPANLGYGSRGAGGVIPPNATLVFDVELLGLK